MDLNILNSSRKNVPNSLSREKGLKPHLPSSFSDDLEKQWLTLDLTGCPSKSTSSKFIEDEEDFSISKKKEEPVLSMMSNSLPLSSLVAVPQPPLIPLFPTSSSLPPTPSPQTQLERLENCELQLSKLGKQLDDLNSKMDELLLTCRQIDTRIVEHNEREVNLQIRKYSIQKHKGTNNPVPLHFVPSTTNGKKHFGLFTDLLK